MGWEEAVEHSRREAVEVDEKRWPLIVVDHFDLTMVDMTAAGARLRVRPLTRLEAISLARLHDAPAIALNDRGQNMLEKEMQIEPAVRPQVRYRSALLVVQVVRWNDVRCYLVEYEADGDGCIP
jgi:hypothetical protein